MGILKDCIQLGHEKVAYMEKSFAPIKQVRRRCQSISNKRPKTPNGRGMEKTAFLHLKETLFHHSCLVDIPSMYNCADKDKTDPCKKFSPYNNEEEDLQSGVNTFFYSKKTNEQFFRAMRAPFKPVVC